MYGILHVHFMHIFTDKKVLTCSQSLSCWDHFPPAVHWNVAFWPTFTSTFCRRRKWGALPAIYTVNGHSVNILVEYSLLCTWHQNRNLFLFKSAQILMLPINLPITGDFLYSYLTVTQGYLVSICPFDYQSGWTIVQHFVLHAQNIIFPANPSYKITYRIVLSATWLYRIKFLWQAIPHFWTVLLVLEKHPEFHNHILKQLAGHWTMPSCY